MNIIICGNNSEELHLLTEYVERFCADNCICPHVDSCADWPALAAKLRRNTPDIVLVAQNGVRGLDTVASAQYLVPRIIWISDLDFATQSYRMGIAYFFLKPISYEKIKRAMNHCTGNV